MSDCSIIRSPKMKNSDIEEELESEVPSNVGLNIPEVANKQIEQLLTKRPIQFGQMSTFHDNKHEHTTHFVKDKIHDGKLIEVFECGICSKELGQKYSLKRHLLTHTDERKFRCKICGKDFRRMSTLTQHRAVHSAERSYICEICHKAFKRNSALLTHRKIHTGIKPYRCHICKKAFHQKGTYKAHPFLLYYPFFQGHLHSHIFSHTNERPYKCDMCTKGFKQMSNLVCHINKVHQRADKPRCTCQIRGKDFQKCMCLRNHEQYQHGVQNPELTASQTNNVKYPKGVLVEPINTAAMQHALTNKQTPFALLKPLNGIPVFVRVLAAGEKQMLVPTTVEDFKKHGQIIITPQVDENKKNEIDVPLAKADKPLEEANKATIKSLGSTVQIKIPVVATIVQCYRKDDNICMSIENPEPSTSGIGNQNCISTTTTTTENLDGGNFSFSESD